MRSVLMRSVLMLSFQAEEEQAERLEVTHLDRPGRSARRVPPAGGFRSQLVSKPEAEVGW
jgi:hypothetical protein